LTEDTFRGISPENLSVAAARLRAEGGGRRPLVPRAQVLVERSNTRLKTALPFSGAGPTSLIVLSWASSAAASLISFSAAAALESSRSPRGTLLHPLLRRQPPARTCAALYRSGLPFEDPAQTVADCPPTG